MANHGFVSSRKHFKKDKVYKDLVEINNRRFKGLLKIEDSEWGELGSWQISYPNYKINGENSYAEFNIWIASPRVLEHRHTRSWMSYVEIVFAEEMGAKYNGTMSDEGTKDKWKPEPNKYPSYFAWLNIYYNAYHGPNKVRPIEEVEFIKELTKSQLNYAPEELRDC